MKSVPAVQPAVAAAASSHSFAAVDERFAAPAAAGHRFGSYTVNLSLATDFGVSLEAGIVAAVVDPQRLAAVCSSTAALWLEPTAPAVLTPFD